MPLRATLREDNALELPEDAPRLFPSSISGAVPSWSRRFVVTENEPQIPQTSSEFRDAVKEADVTVEQLLGNLSKVKQELVKEEDRA